MALLVKLGKVQDCYNIGKTQLETSRKDFLRHGSLAGAVLENGYVENCHCWCEDGVKEVDDVQTDQSKIDVQSYANKEDLKVIASKLGEEFKEDTNNINNGYPILKWQEE